MGFFEEGAKIVCYYSATCPQLCRWRPDRECGEATQSAYVIEQRVITCQNYTAHCPHIVFFKYVEVLSTSFSCLLHTILIHIPTSSIMPPSRRHTEDSYLRVPRRRVAPSPSPLPARRNLRDYLDGAHLPSISRNDSSHPYYLPLRGRRSHKNRLRVKKDPQRHIDEIRQHEPKTFNDATKTCQ